MTGQLSKIEFASGLVKDDTPLASEGGWIDAQNMRFRQGKPETRGGWELAAQDKFTGIARSIKTWTDLRGQSQAAFGTGDKLWAFSGGSLIDITPPHSEGTLLNPFTTTSGSAIVTVAQTEHAFAQGQTVTYSNATAVGGLTINGDYAVTSVLNRNSFTITAASNATSAATGGASVDYRSALPAGLVDGTGGLGFGTGSYGSGPYGLPSVNDFMPRIWSLDNFGEILLASPRGGALYAWQPAVTYSEILTTSNFAGGTGWTTTANGGTAVAGTASNLSQNVKNVLQGGYVYRVTFDAVVTAGSLSVKVNAGTPTPAPIDLGMPSIAITKSGTYSRTFVCPANPSDILFSKDATFAGSINNASIKLEKAAYRINEAPYRADSMFVDPHGIIVLAGCYGANGDYNPLLLRWSGLRNLRSWIPDTTTIAGEIAVAVGGRIVAGLPSRATNLIWTDVGLHAMTFVASSSPAGFSVNLIATECGLIGRNAATGYNGIAFWLSNNGNFYQTTFDYQGAIPKIIDCRIRSDCPGRLAASQNEKIYASVNAQFTEIQWFYADTRDGIECSRAVVYNFAENHWTGWTEARSCWAGAGTFPSPLACGTDGYLYYHERGTTANGNPIPNYIETAWFDIEDGGNLMIADRFVPDFQRQTDAIAFTVTGKLWPNATETMTRTRTAMPTTRKLDFRIKARQMKIRLSASTPWRAGLWRLEAQKAGSQR